MTDYAAEIEAELGAAPSPDKAHDYAAEIEGELPGAAPKKPKAVRDEELEYDPERTMGFGSQAVGSFASDDTEWMRHAAKTLYPDEPLERSVKRFGRTSEGRYFHRGDDGKTYEVKPPGWSLSNIGSGVGYALPVGAGTVAGIATAPMAATGVGATGTLAATAGAGAAGEWLRQGIGDVILGDEVSTGDLNKTAIATEGVLSGMGQGVGVGLGRWAQKYVAPDIGRLSTQAADDLYDKASRLKTKLTPGEATGLQSQIAEQKRLTSVPQSANIMDDFYKARNKDAAADYRAFLDSVSPARDAGRVGETAHRAAERMTSAAQAERTRAVTPFYEQAEREVGFVDPSDVVGYIDQELPTAKGSIRTALEYARQQLMTRGGTVQTDRATGTNPTRSAIQHMAGGEASDTSFRGLDNAKKAVDAVLQNEDLAARKGIDRSAYYALEHVRRLLVRALDSAAGNNGAYATGRRTYEGITQSVIEPLEQALAPLMRVNPQRGTMLVNAAKGMLDPATRSPELVAAARRAFTTGPNAQPQAWDSLVRQYLQREAHAALQPLAKGEVSNVPGRLSKAIGDENVMANLRAALPAGRVKALEDMLDVFRAAARSLDANSDTAFKQEAIRTAKRRDMGAMAKVIEIVRPWEKARAAQDFFAERNYAKQAEAIARIITSGDRTAINRLRSLKHYKANDWRRWAIIGEALTRAGEFGAERATD